MSTLQERLLELAEQHPECAAALRTAAEEVKFTTRGYYADAPFVTFEEMTRARGRAKSLVAKMTGEIYA